MFRRPFGRPMRRPQGVDMPPALRRAHELMAIGEYAAAAENFELFARGAVQRGGPRAPIFLLQAGRCRILAGHVPVGMNHIQQGLSIFAARGQTAELQRAGIRIVAELNERGLGTEATQIEAYLKTSIPADFSARPGSGAAKPKRVLPTNCPGCGGPIRSDEVEWVDEATADCPFCGSPIRAE
jgi:hypothetical protein